MLMLNSRAMPARRTIEVMLSQRSNRFHAYLFVIGLFFSLILLQTGCSSFNSAWRKAGRNPAPTHSMTGRWEGRWISDVNGHHGKLRCIVTSTDENYAARFRATYMHLLHFSYTVPLTISASNEVWQFQGEEDLGAVAGGIYRYLGTATATNFRSTYDSKYDHGKFEMHRL